MNSAFSLPLVVPSRSRTFPSIKERTTIETICVEETRQDRK